jgi:predicted RNA-binding Zn ribbon-like protein
MADASDLPLLGGHLSLDFANTLEWRDSEREKDWLTGYDALVAWALKAGAVEAREAEELRAYSDWAPGSAAEVLAEARALRAAFYRVASALAAGGAAGEIPAGDHLDDLNVRLAPLLGQTRLNRTSAGLVSAWGGASDDLARVLWPVARAAFDLLTGAEAGRLRECAGRDCHWLFLDRSKNGSRRWCAMANCGNAAKARRHRAKSHRARSQRGRRQNTADSGGQAA